MESVSGSVMTSLTSGCMSPGIAELTRRSHRWPRPPRIRLRSGGWHPVGSKETGHFLKTKPQLRSTRYACGYLWNAARCSFCFVFHKPAHNAGRRPTPVVVSRWETRSTLL
eukprot:scaffold8627_cov133-Isochrysis_galbana.AAC.1